MSEIKNNNFLNRLLKSEYLPVFIYLMAFMVRFLFILDINSKILFSTLMGDPDYYDSWAMKILGGDFLGSGVWEMSPLYPYVLAFIYKIFGHNYLIVSFFQIIAGSSTCVLIYYIGKELFSSGAGLAAALLAVFSGTMIFHDGVIMKTPFGVLLITLFLYLSILISKGKLKEKGLFLTGVEFGLLCLVRENALILVLLMAIVLSANVKKTGGNNAVNYFLLFIFGFAIIVFPVTLRNNYVGGDWVLITSKYGETFYEGNNPEADGTYSPPGFVRSDPVHEHADFTRKAQELTGRTMLPSEVANFWLREGVKFIIKQPVKWSEILLKKIKYLFNNYEGPDNYDYSFSSQYSFMLKLPLVTFGIIGPLSIVGMFFGLRKFKEIYPLYAIILLYTCSLLLFFIFSRLRMYIVPALTVFAGYGLVETIAAFARKDRKSFIKAIVILSMFLLVFHLPVERQSYAGSYNSLGCIYSKNKNYNKAVENFTKAAELNEQMPSIWFNLGNAYMDLAKDYEIQNEPQDKINELYGKSHRCLGISYFRESKFNEARVEFRQAIGFMPEDAGNNSYLGITLFYLEKYNEAKKYLEKSLKLNPGLTENIKALAIIYESDNPAKALELWGLYLKNYPDTQEDREERDVIVEHVKELRKSYGNGK